MIYFYQGIEGAQFRWELCEPCDTRGFEYLYLLKEDYEKLPPGAVEAMGRVFATGATLDELTSG